MSFFIGCPIWSFKGWVGNFYPKGTKPADYLREYARRLTTIEGNTTFYAVPSKETLKTWAAEMPASFRFCPKIPQAISHAGALPDHIDEALGFIDVMSALGTRLGPMFLQLPPRFSPSLFADLQVFLSAWPREVRLAVEVRHLDWFDAPHDEALNQLLAEHNMARVTIDTRPIRSLEGDKILAGSVYESLLEARRQKPNVPVLPKRTTDFIFIRYIGHPDLNINQPFLDEWGSHLSAQLKDGATAYVFCHSPENLAAPNLCRGIHDRVRATVPIPPLPWDEANAHVFEQGRLF